jgi:Flp pilus assembly protein TadG
MIAARCPADPARGEGGAVSVVLAAGIAASLVMTMGVADVAKVLAARSSVRTAADAAALAAAQELAFPTGGDPAALAADYAAANGAELVSCACRSGSFEATVEVRAGTGDLLLVPGRTVVVARARAVVDLPSS